MTSRRRTPVEPETAAEQGFPVEVELPGRPDGPLRLTYAGQPSESTYEISNGRTTASTRARLDELVRIGGRPVITPTGGSAADTGGTES